MRKFLIPLFLFLGACTKPVELTPEQSAQLMMKQTVKIQVAASVEVFYKNVDLGPAAIGWSGSGVIVGNIDKNKGQSLILTAAHVSSITREIELGIFKLIVKDAAMSVQKLDGAFCNARPVVTDEQNDVGTILSDCKAGEVAELADELPPQGAMVQDVGAPLGFHPNDVFAIVDGRYQGLTDGFAPMVTLSVPVVGGFSGSGLFYKGKVFGILTRGYDRFEHLSLGTSLEYLKNVVMESQILLAGQ
jgi:hypothetical protein